jgi:Uma2 family endonuclease
MEALTFLERSTMSTAEDRRLTPDEYLALERASDTKHEYDHGRLIAMAGASRAHILIVTNLVRHLGNQLDGSPCETYSNDMRVGVDLRRSYTYPDVVLVCGSPQFLDGRPDTLLNPTVLIEVLSDSTMSYDRGAKFERSLRIGSLRTYVLIAQDRMSVQWFDRSSEGPFTHGRFGLATQPHEALVLATLAVPVSIRLADIYARVEFPPPDESHNLIDPT